MRTLALVTALVLTLPLVGVARAQDADDIAGWYEVVGENPTGTEYTGTAQIRQVDEAWEIDWQIGSAQMQGVGLLRGETLSFLFQLPVDPDTLAIGLITYGVSRKDGVVVLIGPWMLPSGGPMLGRETLTKLKAPPMPDNVRVPV